MIERLRRAASAGIHSPAWDLESRLGVGAGRRAVVLSGLLWAALSGGPAGAADMSSLGIETMPPPAPVIQPGPNTYIDFLDEVRVGVYAHNWIHDEGSPVDVSGEILTSPIGYPNNFGGQWFSWLFDPRINIGAMINTGGKTSYGFTGLTWRLPIYKGFFFEGESAAPSTPRRCAMWATASTPAAASTSAKSGGFGYQFNEHWDLIANIEHISHATFCTHINPGLTQVGARVGYKF